MFVHLLEYLTFVQQSYDYHDFFEVTLILCLFVFFGKENFVSKFNVGLKVLAVFAVFVLFIRTFTYGDKHIISYSAEEEILENQKKFNIMKKWCNIAIVIGGILVFAFLVYFYIFKK